MHGNWNNIRPNDDPTAAIGSLDLGGARRLTVRTAAANNHNIGDVPGAFRDDLLEGFLDMWERHSRAAVFDMVIERTTNTPSETQTYEPYAYVTLMESHIPRRNDEGFLSGDFFILGQSGIHYGGFASM